MKIKPKALSIVLLLLSLSIPIATQALLGELAGDVSSEVDKKKKEEDKKKKEEKEKEAADRKTEALDRERAAAAAAATAAARRNAAAAAVAAAQSNSDLNTAATDAKSGNTSAAKNQLNSAKTSGQSSDSDAKKSLNDLKKLEQELENEKASLIATANRMKKTLKEDIKNETEAAKDFIKKSSGYFAKVHTYYEKTKNVCDKIEDVSSFLLNLTASIMKMILSDIAFGIYYDINKTNIDLDVTISLNSPLSFLTKKQLRDLFYPFVYLFSSSLSHPIAKKKATKDANNVSKSAGVDDGFNSPDFSINFSIEASGKKGIAIDFEIGLLGGLIKDLELEIIKSTFGGPYKAFHNVFSSSKNQLTGSQANKKIDASTLSDMRNCPLEKFGARVAFSICEAGVWDIQFIFNDTIAGYEKAAIKSGLLDLFKDVGGTNFAKSKIGKLLATKFSERLEDATFEEGDGVEKGTVSLTISMELGVELASDFLQLIGVPDSISEVLSDCSGGDEEE
ncbi:hypothetical protein HN446_03820 [bacterium]|jgi:hypothetical protein|nr:hypothetical protein [bacterium]